MLEQLHPVERDQHRLLLIAVDDGGDAACAAILARSSLSGAAAELGGEADDI
jgi:hypothetical protein